MSVTENSGCCGNRWYDKFGLLFLKASFCTVIWKRVSLSLSLSPPALSRLPRWLSFPHLEEQVHVQALPQSFCSFSWKSLLSFFVWRKKSLSKFYLRSFKMILSLSLILLVAGVRSELEDSNFAISRTPNDGKVIIKKSEGQVKFLSSHGFF